MNSLFLIFFYLLEGSKRKNKQAIVAILRETDWILFIKKQDMDLNGLDWNCIFLNAGKWNLHPKFQHESRQAAWRRIQSSYILGRDSTTPFLLLCLTISYHCLQLLFASKRRKAEEEIRESLSNTRIWLFQELWLTSCELLGLIFFYFSCWLLGLLLLVVVIPFSCYRRSSIEVFWGCFAWIGLFVFFCLHWLQVRSMTARKKVSSSSLLYVCM